MEMVEAKPSSELAVAAFNTLLHQLPASSSQTKPREEPQRKRMKLMNGEAAEVEDPVKNEISRTPSSQLEMKRAVKSEVETRPSPTLHGEVEAPPAETKNVIRHDEGRRNLNQPVTVHTSNIPISMDAKFNSFDDFHAALDVWMNVYFHPFRVASSERLNESDQELNERFRYRYIVYHCAHYGKPRKRGAGKRPNQNYLPCGCTASLRLNYSHAERALRITTLKEEHQNHELSADAFAKVSLKRGSPNSDESAERSPAPRLSLSSASSTDDSVPEKRKRKMRNSLPSALNFKTSPSPLVLPQSQQISSLKTGDSDSMTAPSSGNGSAMTLQEFIQQQRMILFTQQQQEQQQLQHHKENLDPSPPPPSSYFPPPPPNLPQPKPQRPANAPLISPSATHLFPFLLSSMPGGLLAMQQQLLASHYLSATPQYALAVPPEPIPTEPSTIHQAQQTIVSPEGGTKMKEEEDEGKEMPELEAEEDIDVACHEHAKTPSDSEILSCVQSLLLEEQSKGDNSFRLQLAALLSKFKSQKTM